VFTAHYAGEGDINGAACASNFDAVEFPSSDPPPKSRARAFQQFSGFFLVYQGHAVCLDSSHYSDPVLSCSLSRQGTRFFG
jgi:hypothetical protein